MADLIPGSKELQEIVRESQRLARDTGHEWGTVHLMLAFFVSERNRAREILEQSGVELELVLAALKDRRKVKEPPEVVHAVIDKTRGLTRRTRHNSVNTLHLLTSLCRHGEGLAYQILKDLKVDPGRVRSVALRDIAEGARPPVSQKKIQKEIAQPTIEIAVIADQSESNSDFNIADQEGISELTPSPDVESHELDPEGNPFAHLGTPGVPPKPARPKRAKKLQTVEHKTIDEESYVLDRKRFALLSQLGRNLTLLAIQEKLDPAIGREKEVGQVLDVLLKRRSNNPLLIGDPGVGKTAIVEGLAQRLTKLPESDPLSGCTLIEIPISSLDAGTHLRGAFTERMQGLMDEVASANGQIIVFFDEIHLLMGTGGGDTALDAGNVLKSALARGAFPCIGATTVDEYSRTIERDSALARRFSAVHIEEPDPGSATEMVSGVLGKYATHHGVTYGSEVAEFAVSLSRRYLPDRALPDKAITLVDEAGSRARRSGNYEVNCDALANVVSELTGIPLTKILVTDQERLMRMEDSLGENIVGHKIEINRMCRVIRRNFAGFRSRRPVGSFLIFGPTGVGKTETARVLANYFFQSPDALRRFDMSEYTDKTSVNKLIGSPAGYEGHDEMPALTQAVWKRSHQVILFDEIEKSDPSLWPIFLQILDEGTVEDRRGYRLDFRESIIIMTSNLGSDVLRVNNRNIGFAAENQQQDNSSELREKIRDRALESARKSFPPELWSRFDERLVFQPLDKDELRLVARLLIAEQSQILNIERGITLRVTGGAIELLLKRAEDADERDGARGLRRIIEEELVDEVAQYLLSHSDTRNAELEVHHRKGQLFVERIAVQTNLEDTVLIDMKELVKAK
jgi:ATP-dependent Clp protease ATP-binding subunit ClpC